MYVPLLNSLLTQLQTSSHPKSYNEILGLSNFNFSWSETNANHAPSPFHSCVQTCSPPVWPNLHIPVTAHLFLHVDYNVCMLMKY